MSDRSFTECELDGVPCARGYKYYCMSCIRNLPDDDTDDDDASAPKYETRITQLTITPVGEPIFCEDAITISIEDDAAGEYVQISGSGPVLHIEPGEHTEALIEAIRRLVEGCRS